MEDEIKQNLVFLTKNLTNLTEVLTYFVQCDIISAEEREDIEAERTLTRKNYKLLSTLQRKDWNQIRNSFLEILRKTKNERCEQVIKGTVDENCVSQSSVTITRNNVQPKTRNTLFHVKINKKWWPEKKLLIKSLLKRKYGNKLLIGELHDRILNDENRMAVICESADASKYSGMGGVGKTLTAKWYGHTYEEKYDHIIWIDCGEGSLLKSFQKLARDLEIPNRNEMIDIEDYSRKCFDTLSGFKCLWIFDNAENYKGEGGIINVLPKYEDNFYCIITSRNNEWGTEKIGFGKISQLELDIFSEEESLEFLNSNLHGSIVKTETQLKDLCQLMGNLPLALQLAAAALNNRKIELQSYIEKTSSKDLGNIVNEKFDDYEKTINQCIKISLDLILTSKNGKLGYEILMIFGYIRPDEVRPKILMKILHTSCERMKAAINILEKYALVTTSGKVVELLFGDGFYNKLLGRDKLKGEMPLLNIHRLLQQVLRHNGRETERDTLRKILACEGFTDYKFIPFTKYADEVLQKEFPKVKAKLLDQSQLKKLIWENRFEESVQLAKFIHGELMTKTTEFNYAICSAKNEQFEESLAILRDLAKEATMKETTAFNRDSMERGLLKLEEELSLQLVYVHSMVIQCIMENRMKSKHVGQKSTMIYSKVLLSILIYIVNSNLFKTTYSIRKEFNNCNMELELGGQFNKIDLNDCLLDLSSFDSLSPEELTLSHVSFTRGGRNLDQVVVNDFLRLDKINRLTLKVGYKVDGVSIDLSDEISMEYVSLQNVNLLRLEVAKANIKFLELFDIPFVTKSKLQVREMEMNRSFLDVACLPQTIEKLELNETFVSGEQTDFSNFKYLTLKWIWGNSFYLSSFKTANLTHCHFHQVNKLDLNQLPQTVTQIKISDSYFSTTKYNAIIVSGVRTVEKLILELLYFKHVKEVLGHFQTNDLVVYSRDGIIPKDLVEKAKKEIHSIPPGIVWDKPNFSIIYSHVNQETDYYLWEAGYGTGINREKFEELMKLY